MDLESYLQCPLQVRQEKGIKVFRDEEDIAAVDDEPLMNRVQDPDAQDLGGNKRWAVRVNSRCSGNIRRASSRCYLLGNSKSPSEIIVSSRRKVRLTS